MGIANDWSMAQNDAARVVLVGDDLSDGGAEALRQGHALAARYGAALHVCHAIPDPGPIEALLGTLDKKSAREMGRLQERSRLALTSRVERFAAPDDVQMTVHIGTAHSVVLKEAKRVDADWIVVGASGKNAAEVLLLGSSASQIVRHAPCTVVVARPMPQSDVVIAATDLSDPALLALERAIEESSKRGSKLVVTHALDLAHPLLSSIEPAVVLDEETAEVVRRSAHETLAGALARFEGAGEIAVVEGAPKRAIVDLAKRSGASLIVVGTHGRTGLARVALGSVAEAVVRRAPCSVMVVR
jgi:nucleotide-binding universal stress UspA family protein